MAPSLSQRAKASFLPFYDFNYQDPGVLILSPFAGAGGLMQEALQVNPYEVENVADTLNRALEMPLVIKKILKFSTQFINIF